MLDHWLATGTAGIFALPFAVGFVIAAAIAWLTHLSPARPFFASCIGIVGPFFASVAILFALFAAFLANEVWRNRERAEAAIAREADGVLTMLRMAEAVGDPADQVRAAAIAYVNVVLEAEWPAMQRAETPEQAIPALKRLALATVVPAFVQSTPLAVHQAVVNAFVDIRQARMERVSVVARHGAPLNWLAMIVLGVLAQVAIASVHLERPRPQALALAIFTTAFAATVALIGLHERPFSGTAISDQPLRAAIATIEP